MHYILVLLIVSLVFSIIGAVSSYVISNYCFGTAAMAVALYVKFFDTITPFTSILCLLYFIFGCSLGIFLFIRDRRKRRNDKNILGIFGVPISIILNLSAISPLAFRLANAVDGAALNERWAWVGAGIMFCAIAWQTISIIQQKKGPVNNETTIYGAGILLWVGSFITCIGANFSVWQWIVAIFGLMLSCGVTISIVVLLDFVWDK